MNNRGFSLVEFLVAIVIISIALFVVGRQIGSTLSITKNDSYKVMKNNIITASNDYILECSNSFSSCKLDWKDNKVSFKAYLLKDNGYFKSLRSPIDGKDLGNCLIVNATRNDGVIDVSLIDECY